MNQQTAILGDCASNRAIAALGTFSSYAHAAQWYEVSRGNGPVTVVLRLWRSRPMDIDYRVIQRDGKGVINFYLTRGPEVRQ
jgi:hypothetical protein